MSGAAGQARTDRRARTPARERWCYDGRRIVDGEDCYVWLRRIEGNSVKRWQVKICALPVDTFWPWPRSVAKACPDSSLLAWAAHLMEKEHGDATPGP